MIKKVKIVRQSKNLKNRKIMLHSNYQAQFQNHRHIRPKYQIPQMK